MQQYLDLCHRIIEMGEWVTNRRTGKRCLTLINADLNYNVAANELPLITETQFNQEPQRRAGP